MSKWPGKLVIGLTGNIGTGKSVVRRMLEHLGAYGIDADALANRAIAKGAPGYKKVITQFGQWIIKEDGEIDRKKLGKIVYSVEKIHHVAPIPQLWNMPDKSSSILGPKDNRYHILW